MLLKDNVAVVTGGAQGMGRAIALKFAEQGCAVAVADIHLDRALETAAAIEAGGRQATTFWDALMPPGEEREGFFRALAKKEVPMQRMGKAEDIAGPALFLASDLSAYMTGQVICAAGGQPLLSHGATFDIEDYLNGRHA
jgi:NAD(P)-dependent dehydrogenase (short-subunit alcohol dehydrogenase family)